jgi:hypothetical protein
MTLATRATMSLIKRMMSNKGIKKIPLTKNCHGSTKIMIAVNITLMSNRKSINK